MQQQIAKIGARSTCATCNKAIIYGSAGWMHQRRPDEPHLGVPVSIESILVEDTLTKALERVVELEATLAVRDKRIEALLAANRELSEKVRK